MTVPATSSPPFSERDPFLVAVPSLSLLPSSPKSNKREEERTSSATSCLCLGAAIVLLVLFAGSGGYAMLSRNINNSNNIRDESVTTAAIIVSGETSKTAKKVVYIIRHGEKIYVPTNETAYKYACLNAEGWSRAYNLISVFGGHNPQHPKLLRTPQAIFSFNYDNGDLDCRTSNQGYYRTQATVAPLANVLNLTVNNVTGSKPDLCGPSKGTPIGDCWQPKPGDSVHDMGPCCNAAAASRIHTKLMTPTVDSILVAWEHANIKYLVEELSGAGGGNITATEVGWPDPQFDKVVALYFSAATGEFLTMDQTLTQGFQWLGPTAAGTEDVDLCAGSYPDVN